LDFLVDKMSRILDFTHCEKQYLCSVTYSKLLVFELHVMSKIIYKELIEHKNLLYRYEQTCE